MFFKDIKTGRRNHCRPLKRLLDTWDRNGSTSGPTPWQIYDGDDKELNTTLDIADNYNEDNISFNLIFKIVYSSLLFYFFLVPFYLHFLPLLFLRLLSLYPSYSLLLYVAQSSRRFRLPSICNSKGSTDQINLHIFFFYCVLYWYFNSKHAVKISTLLPNTFTPALLISHPHYIIRVYLTWTWSKMYVANKHN